MAKAISCTREEAIEMLIEHHYDLFNQGQLSLDEMLRYGWEGFDDRTNKELMDAYNADFPTEMIVIDS